MGPETQSLLAAALEAADRAKLPDSLSFGPRCGVCVAAPAPHFPETIPADSATVAENWPPLWLLGCLPNMTASHLAIQFQASGPCHTLASTHWTDLTQLASDWIYDGEADQAIVVGRNEDGRIRAAILQSPTTAGAER